MHHLSSLNIEITELLIIRSYLILVINVHIFIVVCKTSTTGEHTDTYFSSVKLNTVRHVR